MDAQTQSPIPERGIPAAERQIVEVQRAAFEAAAESPEAAASLLEKVGAEAVVEVKDFTGKFPELGPGAKAQADAVESQIRGLAADASAEIAKIAHPEEDRPAVVATPIVSVGAVPEKLRGRITPEDLAAVTARKEIAIGGSKGVAITAEGVQGIVVTEAPTPEPPKKKEAASEISSEQKERLEKIEAEFNAIVAESDKLFAAGDRAGLERMAGVIDATIAEASSEIVDWKKRNPELVKASAEQLLGFTIGKHLLDIQMARRDRIEAQAELLKKKEANAPAEDIAAIEGKIGSLDAEIRMKAGALIDVRAKQAAAVTEEAKKQFDDFWESYGNGSYGGYGGSVPSAPGAKMPEIAEPLKEKLTTGAERALDVLTSPFERWMSFTVSGKSSIIEELTKWGEELGKSKGYRKNPKA